MISRRVYAGWRWLEQVVQRPFLQGVEQALFTFAFSFDTHWVAPADLKRFPPAYQEGLLEGWGIALGEFELVSPFPWKGHNSPLWMVAAKGFSAGGLVSIQQGQAQFDALFEGPARRVVQPLRHAPQ